MIRSLSNETWLRYSDLLPKDSKMDDPKLPLTLPYQGQVQGPFDYVHPDELLNDLRKWLITKEEQSVFYFLTESVEGEETDFEVSVSQLTHDALSEINRGSENVIVAKNFSWAIFMDHEGTLHVAGPQELFLLLKPWENKS